MTLIEVMNNFGARVSGGSEYGWDCYGPNARYIDFADVAGSEYGHIVHDSKTFEVFEVCVIVPGQEQAFGWHNPTYLQRYLDECKARKLTPYEAWDDVEYQQVDEATIMQYAKDVGEMYYDDLPVPDEVQ